MSHALIGQLMLLLGTPLGVCRVLVPKEALGNSLIFASPTMATKLHPSFSLTPPLAFFPGSFYTALSPLFEHLEHATKPHFVMDLSFSTKEKRV